MRLRSLSIAALAAIAVVVAGCGSSSSSGGSSSTTASSSSSAGAMTKTTSAGSGDAATVTTARSPLGTILVGAGGRTLYLWKADTGTKSMCTGSCAIEWPALTTHGRPMAGAGVNSAMLGTSPRADGTTLVTYAGHPLYYFADDDSAGATNGQGSDGFGALWWVVSPNGTAITKTGSSTPTS